MSPILRDEMTDAERAVVARGHCEFCRDYIEPAARERHRKLCMFTRMLAECQRDEERS